MEQERPIINRRTYTGEGSDKSPFQKLPDIPIYQFAEQVWMEHGQEIMQGNGKFMAVGRFIYLAEGIPDETEVPYQLSLEFRGVNPNYVPPKWAPAQLSEHRKIGSAVLIALSLYRRFLTLHLKRPPEE